MNGNNSTLPQGISRTSATTRLVLAPGETRTIAVYGTMFYIVDSDGIGDAVYISIKTNKTIEELFTAGCGKEFADDQFFSRLDVKNISTTQTVTLTLFSGFGDYIDRRLTIVDGRFNSVVPVREAPTLLKSNNPSTIGAGATLTFNTLPAGTIRRKALVVSNMDLANSLIIRDSANVGGCAVFPQTSVTLPVSGEIKVYNGTASIIVCYISEIFYTV